MNTEKSPDPFVDDVEEQRAIERFRKAHGYEPKELEEALYGKAVSDPFQQKDG